MDTKWLASDSGEIKRGFSSLIKEKGPSPLPTELSQMSHRQRKGDPTLVWYHLRITVSRQSRRLKLNLIRITCAPSIGPILGGSLSYAAGWQWIFWFLCLAAASCLIIMAFFLPETSRNVVGNGSIKPFKYLQLPLPKIMCHWTSREEVANVKWRVPNPLKSLKIIACKDNAVIMFAAGLLYVVYTCINASLSVSLIEVYKLNQWQAGLAYLPFGLGGVVSTFFTGPLIDKSYRSFRLKKGLLTDRIAGDDLDNFPIEKARLQIVWVPMLVTACSVMAFGWVLDRRQVALPVYISDVNVVAS